MRRLRFRHWTVWTRGWRCCRAKPPPGTPCLPRPNGLSSCWRPTAMFTCTSPHLLVLDQPGRIVVCQHRTCFHGASSKQKGPMPCSTGPGKRQAALHRLRLAGRRKRPGGLRVQRCLSRGRYRNRGCFRSGFFRCFLRSGFFRCFLGCRFFRGRFSGGCFFLRRRLLRRGLFLGRSFLGRYLFGRGLLRCGLPGRSFLGRYLFGRGLLRCGLPGRSFLGRCLFSRSLLRRGLLCGRFFRSCHHLLLDQIAKSTSCLLVGMKRSMVLERASSTMNTEAPAVATLCGAIDRRCNS